MLKFIKNLSMLSTTLDSLHAANAIELLIDLLSSSMKKASGYFREISNQVLNTMFNLCRLSKARQEDAAINGIIPLLLKTMKTDRPPKEFALPILCDMAHSGKLGRKYLWQNKGLQFYVSLLDDQYWQVTALDAIFIWYVLHLIFFHLTFADRTIRLQEETAKVEKSLLEGDFIEAIVQCFNAPRASAFDYNLLEPLQKLLRLSSPVAASLARADLYSGILQKLNHKKAVVRLNLLRIVRSICDPSDEQSDSIQDHKLFEAIEHLAENDSAVLVRNMANDLVRSSLEKERESGSGGRSRPPGTGRRKSSFTPPSLQHSMSTPMTPTHGGRISQSPAFINASLTPRRIAATSHSNGDSIMYRPRSRDGATPQIPRRVSGENAANGASSVSKSRLPRTSMLRSSRSSLAAPLPRDESSLPKRDNGVKLRERTRSTASNSPALGGTAPQLNSKRRGRVPSGDIKWS